MPFRITDTNSSASFGRQIGAARQRVADAQEHVASGKRINRPSDDPAGAGAVLRLRTTQAAITQFQRSAGAAQDTLAIGDGTLDGYERLLDRARVLLTQGASFSLRASDRAGIAAEIEGLREQILAIANAQSGGRYVFGGSRQDAPPFDPATGAAAQPPAAPMMLQIEPGTPPIIIGVMAEAVFTDATGTVMDALAAAATALRDGENWDTERQTVLSAMDRLTSFATQASSARAQLGASLGRVDAAQARLSHDFLALEATAQRIESADFVEAALRLTESASALEAILQTKAQTSRRSLIDFLG